MNLDWQVCSRARLSRDPRFDGRFFVAVSTTGIYCRPICPARTPHREHVTFFPSAAAAQEAGILHLHADPEAVAEILFSLGDGLALRMLSEPERNFTPTIRAGIASVRALLTD